MKHILQDILLTALQSAVSWYEARWLNDNYTPKRPPHKERNYNIAVKGVTAVLIVDMVVSVAIFAVFRPDKFKQVVRWLKSLSKKNEEG